ncbi:MAG: S-methyl-5-thioribose kinase [Actinomycetota bacterium]|nr:S-methyl-5-thioribose kinase [Actinomycetota bacterium]
MSQTYEFISADNIKSYLASHREISSVIDHESIVDLKEVGDGNLNLVFIIKDKNGKGIVLKQALPYVRLVGPSWPMSPDRARIEYETTMVHSKAAAHLVPEIYFYDQDRYIIAMEDLSDHRVWRTALNQGDFDNGAAKSVGEYIAKVLFATSIFGAGAYEHYKSMARAINPELCLITEDLVFTEPYFPADRNSYLPENEVDAKAIENDKQMVLEMGELKYKFMTQAEALLHGDLHTGSVMVKSDENGNEISTRAFDSEFSFYGPIGFDIGACFANFYLALARSIALGRDEHAEYISRLPEELWASFEANMRALWPSRVDKRVFTDEFFEKLIKQWKVDAIGFAAAKMTRRIVGLAKASDIQTLDPSHRVGAARGVLQSAQKLIRERHINSDISYLTLQVKKIMTDTKTGRN